MVKRKSTEILLKRLFLSNTDKNATMAEFLKLIQNTSDLQTVYQNVQKDSLNALNSTGISNSMLVADNSMDQS